MRKASWFPPNLGGSAAEVTGKSTEEVLPTSYTSPLGQKRCSGLNCAFYAQISGVEQLGAVGAENRQHSILVSASESGLKSMG
ncbi:MAG: hypothetical protein NZ602_12465 [Thermoguttaceae bacterium]|nr:hypothetical protein [Thermoguttaceae bacterium]MDW8037295.1 hypothetical protein [Thermoguttaceae bacterium]